MSPSEFRVPFLLNKESALYCWSKLANKMCDKPGLMPELLIYIVRALNRTVQFVILDTHEELYDGMANGSIDLGIPGANWKFANWGKAALPTAPIFKSQECFLLNPLPVVYKVSVFQPFDMAVWLFGGLVYSIMAVWLYISLFKRWSRKIFPFTLIYSIHFQQRSREIWGPYNILMVAWTFLASFVMAKHYSSGMMKSFTPPANYYQSYLHLSSPRKLGQAINRGDYQVLSKHNPYTSEKWISLLTFEEIKLAMETHPYYQSHDASEITKWMSAKPGRVLMGSSCSTALSLMSQANSLIVFEVEGVPFYWETLSLPKKSTHRDVERISRLLIRMVENGIHLRIKDLYQKHRVRRQRHKISLSLIGYKTWAKVAGYMLFSSSLLFFAEIITVRLSK